MQAAPVAALPLVHVHVFATPCVIAQNISVSVRMFELRVIVACFFISDVEATNELNHPKYSPLAVLHCTKLYKRVYCTARTNLVAHCADSAVQYS